MLDAVMEHFPKKLSSNVVFTPTHIVNEMLDTLPDNVWNPNTTFLDPTCKSGVFLHEIYCRLMDSGIMKKAFEDEDSRRKHIFENQLYGIAMDTTCWLLSLSNVFGGIEYGGHLIPILDDTGTNIYDAVLTNKDKSFLQKILQKEFNRMTFDIVIGNPPYNRGGGTSTSSI